MSKVSQMQGQALFEQYSNIPYQQFSAHIFEEELKRLVTVFSQRGMQLIRYINQVDEQFNESELKKLIQQSKNSEELVRLMEPYLSHFDRFANQLFPSIESFFTQVENSEAILHGFRFRFMLDLGTILNEASQKQLFLLDARDADFKKAQSQLSKVFKEVDEDSRALITQSMRATPEAIQEEILKSRKKSFFNMFASRSSKMGILSRRYSKFIQDIREDLENQLRREPFVQFDRIRVSMYNDIYSNKIQLNFIKKLQEYLHYLEQIEAQIFELERDLMFIFSVFNYRVIELNKKITYFINYILNEDSFTQSTKSRVKAYLQKVDKVEEQIKAFSELEKSIEGRIQQLDSYLNSLVIQFKEKITQAQAQNLRNPEEVLRGRLN